MKKLSLSKALATLLLVFASVAVQAHTALKESTPANGATVAAIPASIELEFTASVRLVKLELTMSGHAMPTGFRPSSEAMTSFSIPTPGMHPGNFTVNWAVIGADGHTVTDSFSFKVDPSATAAD